MADVKQIRHELAEVIRNGTTGLPVLESRHTGNPVRALPVACVYLTNLNRNIDTIGRDRTVENTAEFRVDVHADRGSKDNVDDNLDDLYLELLPLIESDRTLNGKAFHVYVDAFDKDVSEEGEKPRGVAQLTVNITFYETQQDTGGI